MKIDSGLLQVGYTNYEEHVAINMVKITEDLDMAEFEDSQNQIEIVYPKAGEGLVKFLHRCKAEDSKVMMCPWCSVVFDKKVAKKVEIGQREKKKEN